MTNAVKGSHRKKRMKATTPDDPALEFAKNFPYLGGLSCVADTFGELTAVLIPMTAFRRLMLDYQSIATALNTTDADLVDWDQALNELRADGILPPKS